MFFDCLLARRTANGTIEMTADGLHSIVSRAATPWETGLRAEIGASRTNS